VVVIIGIGSSQRNQYAKMISCNSLIIWNTITGYKWCPSVLCKNKNIFWSNSRDALMQQQHQVALLAEDLFVFVIIMSIMIIKLFDTFFFVGPISYSHAIETFEKPGLPPNKTTTIILTIPCKPSIPTSSLYSNYHR
jgi:hypothetical protein